MKKIKVKKYAHDQSPLAGIKSKTRLAEVLYTDWAALKKIISSYKDHYNIFTDNSRGKARVIEEPIHDMRELHDRIADLLARIMPPDFLFCPVKGRSSISNAREHIAAGELVKLDITKYFPSTTFGRIFNFFHLRMLCARDVAWHLAALCTYNGHLPTGSPLSPCLSYYAHENMWLEIKRICDEVEYKLTVYMDDIGISGPSHIDEKIIWCIKREIKKYGLKYHKERKYLADEPKLITGAIIKDGQLKLRNKHHLKIRNTKRALAVCTDSKERQILENTLRGLLAYKKQIENT